MIESLCSERTMKMILIDNRKPGKKSRKVRLPKSFENREILNIDQMILVVKKVGHFLKTTGATIAKFGLKVVQSVGTVAAKVLSVIPVVGKAVGKAVGGVAKLAGLASDKIHANLGKKLKKGMEVMNKANKIMGFIPRRRDLSEDEAVHRQEIGDGYCFEERDDIAFKLEHREEYADEQDFYAYYYLDSSLE